MGAVVIDKKILVMEDDPAMRQILVDTFTGAGFSVIMAEDGLTGLQMALSIHPDLIILDILLPKMDGLTVLRTLSKDPWGKAVPVLVCTNVGDAVEVAKTIKEGVQDFFVKTECNFADMVIKAKERLHISE